MYKQLALCIGNNEYEFSCLQKLECAARDAKDIAKKLENLGYVVNCYTNMKRDEMYRAVNDFEKRLIDYDVGLFYFAGHGFESRGKNLLMPIDLDAIDETYCEWMALGLESIIDALEGKYHPNKLKVKIIVLDACRQKPDGRGAISQGFAPIFAPKGTLIAFSTSPGQTAIERNGHGLYTHALLSSIDIPRIPVENMFKHAREILAADTMGKQISWEHTSLMGNYFFNEDRIDSFVEYSPEALCDNNYLINKKSEIGTIILELKTHDWYKQNPAISLVRKVDFAAISASDIFVLGRNIYQCADGGAWAAQGFIDGLHDDKSILSTAKIHLLNGMAFEIYFNSHGAIRTVFKTDYYLEVLSLMEVNDFQASRVFVTDKLKACNDRIIYIPGSEYRYGFHIVCHEDTAFFDAKVQVVDKILYNGINVMYDENGEYEIDDEDAYLFSTSGKKANLRTQIAKAIVAPPDMIILSFDIDYKPNTQFLLPFKFIMKRQGGDS